ncbi:ADP-ribosyl-[dinitrogen reductase] hydrolase [Paracoccus isoporae]|uniref:ADP-ribosyl-[dinitrogen reductase] hydrolase n=1 Tax=Paracoccus isoporae TaxID=591205 RepID=A0A1G6X473_9RHOB|nr:ADP-ribosylglycohydrolase family protein [Paracoccus isoporae]SDD72713.1 ADP-ribosyl-[dinitrogen reductase] hydrolase [Paracoccus isoporae]
MGLAVGDALGASVETLAESRFAPVTGYLAGGSFRHPAGAWTDDTAMALCLADSLAETDRFDASDLLYRFCRWAELGENTSTGVCIGAGKNTLRALGQFRRTGSLEAPHFGRHGDGNGALMRLAPVAIRFRDEPALAVAVAALQSRTSHASKISEACCAFAADLMRRLILGDPWKDAIDAAYGSANPAVRLRLSEALLSEKPPSTGYVADMLQAAIWATAGCGTFADAVLLAVNLGGDADTIGAVTGQIAGARWGYLAIPQEWRSELVLADNVLAASERLISRRPGGRHGVITTGARA